MLQQISNHSSFATLRNAVASAVVAAVCFSSVPVRAADVLTIGSDAPALEVEHWVQDGQGKFAEVNKFESGKVYVVEFWATWCGPCIQSMPHLAELQRSYASKGVQIVSISDEDLETVNGFLQREVRGGAEGGDAPKTYQELTSAYCLTTDPDRSVYTDYMEAAGQGGIPTAFIVGKDAKVEWIGHPMEMDGPLAAVVDGSWDRDAFGAEFKAKQEAELAMRSVMALLQGQKFDEAIATIDELLAKNSDNLQLNILKLQVLLVTEKLDVANEHLSGVYNLLAERPTDTEMVAWNIYQMAAQGRIADAKIVSTSIAAAKAAVDKLDDGARKASLMDTVAHLLFENGDVDEAIAIETAALKQPEISDRAFMEEFLKELKAAKDAPNEPASNDAPGDDQ